jgi:hypothetical protein
MQKPGRSGAEWGLESKFVARSAVPQPPAGSGASTAAAASAATEPQAFGAATLLRARDGRTYVFFSLRTGIDARQREDEIRLMLSSLRLTGKRRS